jgi:flagellin
MIGMKTNVPSLVAQRNLGHSNKAMQSGIAKLSSGFRINSAADDAAGLAVSERMKADIRSINQSIRNGNDAISVVQTAEGALDEIHNILGRMRELVTQANSDSINNEQRKLINTEFTELQQEIDDIALRTQFSGRKLLASVPAGGQTTLSFQVGIDGEDMVDIALSSVGYAANQLGGSVPAGAPGAGNSNRISSINIGTAAFTPGGSLATNALTSIDTAIAQISDARSQLGAKQNRLESKINNLMVLGEKGGV